jgi:hypothetical protein
MNREEEHSTKREAPSERILEPHINEKEENHSPEECYHLGNRNRICKKTDERREKEGVQWRVDNVPVHFVAGKIRVPLKSCKRLSPDKIPGAIRCVKHGLIETQHPQHDKQTYDDIQQRIARHSLKPGSFGRGHRWSRILLRRSFGSTALAVATVSIERKKVGSNVFLLLPRMIAFSRYSFDV